MRSQAWHPVMGSKIDFNVLQFAFRIWLSIQVKYCTGELKLLPIGLVWARFLTKQSRCILIADDVNVTIRFNRKKARDTATSMNMGVDLDTDPTYEDTTEKAVVVVSPLNTLISDQMERWKSLKSAKKVSTWAVFP